MLSAIPYVTQEGADVPVQTEGQAPEFCRIVEHAFGTKPDDLRAIWVADVPTPQQAVFLIALLEGPQPTREPVYAESAAGKVAPTDAAEALDAMDDYARMDSGVNAHGPRAVLQRFIREVAMDRGVAEPAMTAGTEFNTGSLQTDEQVSNFLMRQGLTGQERKQALLVFPADWPKKSFPGHVEQMEFLYGLKSLKFSQIEREQIMRAFNMRGVFAARHEAAKHLKPTFRPLISR